MKQINMNSPVNNYCNELHVEVKFSPFRIYINISIALALPGLKVQLSTVIDFKSQSEVLHSYLSLKPSLQKRVCIIVGVSACKR
jgi:hypothetical protein